MTQGQVKVNGRTVKGLTFKYKNHATGEAFFKVDYEQNVRGRLERISFGTYEAKAAHRYLCLIARLVDELGAYALRGRLHKSVQPIHEGARLSQDEFYKKLNQAQADCIDRLALAFDDIIYTEPEELEIIVEEPKTIEEAKLETSSAVKDWKTRALEAEAKLASIAAMFV